MENSRIKVSVDFIVLMLIQKDSYIMERCIKANPVVKASFIKSIEVLLMGKVNGNDLLIRCFLKGCSTKSNAMD